METMKIQPSETEEQQKQRAQEEWLAAQQKRIHGILRITEEEERKLDPVQKKARKQKIKEACGKWLLGEYKKIKSVDPDYLIEEKVSLTNIYFSFLRNHR